MDFCDDILFNILLRIPARTLHRRTRYVCKRWFCIISSTSFVYSHLNLSRPGILLESRIDERSRYEFVIDNDRRVVGRYIATNLRLLGSCNGLLLLASTLAKDPRNIVKVCNPVTGPYLDLPPFCHNYSSPSDVDGGIAFDPLAKEYKVVVLFRILSFWDCKILTLGGGGGGDGRSPHIWRRVPCFPHSGIFSNPSILTNTSFLNWIGHDSMVSLDVCEEKVRRIEFDKEMTSGRYLGLSVMGGKLAVWMETDDAEMVIWAVHDDDVWTKLLVIPQVHPRFDHEAVPIGIMSTGGEKEEQVIVFKMYTRRGVSFFTYNPIDRTESHLSICLLSNVRPVLCLQHVHVDSLVSCSFASRPIRHLLEFEIGDYVFLRILPIRGSTGLGVRGELSPRFIGPFDILERVDGVGYRLALPHSLKGVHDVFHVSRLRRDVRDEDHLLDHSELTIGADLSYEQQPMAIIDRMEKVLRYRVISLVKVAWRNHSLGDATWEREDDIRQQYPYLFEEP